MSKATRPTFFMLSLFLALSTSSSWAGQFTIRACPGGYGANMYGAIMSLVPPVNGQDSDYPVNNGQEASYFRCDSIVAGVNPGNTFFSDSVTIGRSNGAFKYFLPLSITDCNGLLLDMDQDRRYGIAIVVDSAPGNGVDAMADRKIRSIRRDKTIQCQTAVEF